jgi:hypothetical protein
VDWPKDHLKHYLLTLQPTKCQVRDEFHYLKIVVVIMYCMAMVIAYL